MGGGLAAGLGLVRSLVLYHAVPFKIRRLTQLYRPFVQPGGLCFDLGAHVGDRTRAFLRLGARVIAVEPQPLFADFLQRVFGRNPRVTVVRCAVGRKEGKAVLHVSDRTPTVSTLSSTWIERVRQASRFSGLTWDREIPTPITTLDALIGKYGVPALCKIDVEGSELEVLEGLSGPLRALSFEYVPALRSESGACLDRLEALGEYEYNWSVREIPRLRSARWLNREEMASMLDGLSDRDHSGDIYARLKARPEGLSAAGHPPTARESV